MDSRVKETIKNEREKREREKLRNEEESQRG